MDLVTFKWGLKEKIVCCRKCFVKKQDVGFELIEGGSSLLTTS